MRKEHAGQNELPGSTNILLQELLPWRSPAPPPPPSLPTVTRMDSFVGCGGRGKFSHLPPPHGKDSSRRKRRYRKRRARMHNCRQTVNLFHLIRLLHANGGAALRCSFVVKSFSVVRVEAMGQDNVLKRNCTNMYHMHSRYQLLKK